MTSSTDLNNARFSTTFQRLAVWIIIGIAGFVVCVAVMCYRFVTTSAITEVRTSLNPGLATGLAAQESGMLVAAISNRNLSVIDMESGITIYRYTATETETCGQGLCWNSDEKALLFSTGSEVHCVDIQKNALSRGIATTHHFRITQLMFYNNLLLIAGDIPGDFGVYGHVEVWRWNGTGNSLTKEHELKAIDGNAQAMSLQCNGSCCVAAIASGRIAGVTLVPFRNPGDWNFSTVRHIPIDATLVSRLDNERFVFKGPGYVEVYKAVNCGDTVTREWRVAIDADREAQYPINHAGYRSLDVVNGGIVVLGTANELVVLDDSGTIVVKRNKQTGAVCARGQSRTFLAAHPGRIAEYQLH